MDEHQGRVASRVKQILQPIPFSVRISCMVLPIIRQRLDYKKQRWDAKRGHEAFFRKQGMATEKVPTLSLFALYNWARDSLLK